MGGAGPRIALLLCFLIAIGGLHRDPASGSLRIIAPAYAICLSCATDACAHGITRALNSALHSTTRDAVSERFRQHRDDFILERWFRNHVQRAMMMMTEQLVSASMMQMMSVGTFFDARQMQKTLQTYQTLTARAHKDYHPSVQMCSFGTLSTSLASSYMRGEYNAHALNAYFIDRQIRHGRTAAAGQEGVEVRSRWEQFRNDFCNPWDNNRQFMIGPAAQHICEGDNAETVNRDVDFTRTVDYPLTIRANFFAPDSSTSATDTDAIFALGRNLYGHNVFWNIPGGFLENEEYQDEYMYVRGILAKRSVAQNSFNAIIGLKSEGTPSSVDLGENHMSVVMRQLGMNDDDEIRQYLHDRPSYYAQMELLTKKLYQTPQFYTNLYDKPANIDRTRAAMRAIGLMQNMDMYNSRLRNEMLLAVMTELEIARAQRVINDRIGSLRASGIRRVEP